MGSFIHTKITFNEICAVALREAADQIDSALDTGAFLAALGNNCRLWRTIRDIRTKISWSSTSDSDCEFAVNRSSAFLRTVSDADAEALMALSRRIVASLLPPDEEARICQRLRLAYKDAAVYDDFNLWLLYQMRRKAEIRIPLTRMSAEIATVVSDGKETPMSGE